MTFAYIPEEGNVTATLGPYFNRTNFGDKPSGAESRTLRGWGLIAQGDANDKGALEIALFHTKRNFFREQGGLYVGEQAELIEIAMGYRVWLTKTFSFATDFYSSYTMGEQVLIHSDFPPGAAPDTSARDTTEYGLDFSLQTELFSYNRYALILDTRYSYSFTNKADERGDQYAALIGIKYLIQEKYPDAKPVKK